MKRLSISVLAFSTLLTAPATARPVANAVEAQLTSLMAIYRDLHQNPELSFQETRSAALMAAEARKAGFEVTEGVGRTGVVAVLRNGTGPVVLVRADMDALPVVEQTGLAFASKARGTSTAGVESGIMHACGHDTHMTAWIGTARLLAASKDQWSGTVIMIGQPAEETNEGALAMIKDGLLTRWPRPDFAMAFHDTGDLPAGTIGMKPGFALANVDSVDITVRGLGGHGAYPHTTKDPIVLASAIVMRLQTIVSRESSPFDPAVVTVGAFHGGAKHNIIPDEVKLQLTVRSYSDASRRLLLDGIKRITRAEALASGIPDDRMPEVRILEPSTRATWNTPEFTARLASRFKQHFGDARVVDAAPVMAGEDFGEFARTAGTPIQSVIFWVGGRDAVELATAQRDGRILPSLHSPFFAPQADKVVATATEAMTVAVLDLLRK